MGKPVVGKPYRVFVRLKTENIISEKRPLSSHFTPLFENHFTENILAQLKIKKLNKNFILRS